MLFFLNNLLYNSNQYNLKKNIDFQIENHLIHIEKDDRLLMIGNIAILLIFVFMKY
jgi:hypothetical protein